MQRTTALTERATDALSASASASLRVLVVDPDTGSRALCRTALSFAGCEVIEASDGREALARALAYPPPALIISELDLPFVDGYALCELLRNDAATQSAPIIIVTTEARSTALERIRKAGADAVLVKPIVPDAMMREVHHLTTRSADVRHESVLTPDITPASGSASMGTRRTVLAKSHTRFRTNTPPQSPPALTCPSCDRALKYEHSQIGGVNDRQAEQWDYYTCSMCGEFQHRQRTRKIRRVQ